jgi:hypothetical protein
MVSFIGCFVQPSVSDPRALLSRHIVFYYFTDVPVAVIKGIHLNVSNVQDSIVVYVLLIFFILLIALTQDGGER